MRQARWRVISKVLQDGFERSVASTVPRSIPLEINPALVNGVLSALPPTADIRQRIEHVCFVPLKSLQLKCSPDRQGRLFRYFCRAREPLKAFGVTNLYCPGNSEDPS